MLRMRRWVFGVVMFAMMVGVALARSGPEGGMNTFTTADGQSSQVKVWYPEDWYHGSGQPEPWIILGSFSWGEHTYVLTYGNIESGKWICNQCGSEIYFNAEGTGGWQTTPMPPGIYGPPMAKPFTVQHQ